MSPAGNKRQRLLDSANELILMQGFRQTTLSDIAGHAGVPLGNLYYYFKTKDDIGKSVIQLRIADMQDWLQQCASLEDPRQRLVRFLDYPLAERGRLSRWGCPLGTLSYELGRSGGSLASSAHDLIDTVLDWSRRQFEAMGRADAGRLAIQFVSSLQGMSLVASARSDPAIVDTMVENLTDWLQSLE